MNARVIETTLLLSLVTAPNVARAVGELRSIEQNGAEFGCPVQEIDVDSKIDGVVATVTVEQLFANPYEHAIEAVYLLPMPNGAAVHAYQIQIGERTIRGEIREAEAARREYEAAKRGGKTRSEEHTSELQSRLHLV